MGAALSFSVLGGSVPASLEVKILGFPLDQVVVLVGTRSPKAMMACPGSPFKRVYAC